MDFPPLSQCSLFFCRHFDHACIRVNCLPNPTGLGSDIPLPPSPLKLQSISEHDQLLHDLKDYTPNSLGTLFLPIGVFRALFSLTMPSIGARLDDEIRKLLTVSVLDSRGGPAAKRTVRLLIAVLLKHLGYVASALSYVNDESLTAEAKCAIQNQLLDIWSKGQQFQRYIVNQFQSCQVRYFRVVCVLS